LSLGPADSLALLENAGFLKTRFAQTVQNPLPAFFVVLSKNQQCMFENSSFKGKQHQAFRVPIFTDLIQVSHV